MKRRLFGRLYKILAWIAVILGVGIGLVGLLVVVGLVRFVANGACTADLVYRKTQLPDLSFDVDEQSCGLFGAVHFLTVTVSRPGSWNPFAKATVMDYRGEEQLSVTRIDDKTIRISVWGRALGDSRRDHWDGLTFVYDMFPLPPKSPGSKPSAPIIDPKDVPPVFPAGERPLDKQ